MHDAADPVALDALVLPAFAAEDFTPQPGTDPPHELEPWLRAYDLDRSMAVPGANAPLRYAADGSLGITPTGMGKADAAATTTALLAHPGLDLSGTLVVSVGIAGGPPSACTLGSVVASDALVDWDRKYRWAERDQAERGGDADRAIDLLSYRPHDYVHRLDPALVADAVDAAEDVALADSEAAQAARDRYDAAAARSPPAVAVGTQVCGDEFWHGPTCSRWAAWLAEAYDAGPYVACAMEDYGTATALDRVGRLDRYLSVRGIANFDRPRPGQSVRASLREETGAFAIDLAVENAFRVGSRVVDRLAGRG